MPVEIERKFLLTSDAWRDGMAGVVIRQGYLSGEPERTVRVRMAGDQGFITVKGKTTGVSRPEFEYEIPGDEATALLAFCLESLVEKTRYRLEYGGHVWEIDEFHGDNAGLVVAEIELPDENARFPLPPRIGMEVSGMTRYANSNLSARPFNQWSERDKHPAS